jgi:hypothetical protein
LSSEQSIISRVHPDMEFAAPVPICRALQGHRDVDMAHEIAYVITFTQLNKITRITGCFLRAGHNFP